MSVFPCTLVLFGIHEGEAKDTWGLAAEPQPLKAAAHPASAASAGGPGNLI
jgi:hypothetical protein